MNLWRLNIGVLLLRIFVLCLVADTGYFLYVVLTRHFSFWLILCFGLVQIFLFWTGIVSVYVSSRQLGLKTRIFGILFGPVPILHLIMLLKIIEICSREYQTETALLKKDLLRADRQICRTKYPILLVHGVFFRDSGLLNYWGRIPEELEKNGAVIFYGNHNSASSVDDSAEELADRIREIAEEFGCEKLNVIAHSKGGLDMRTAIAKTSASAYVASLTTINTPHRGCEFADYFLHKISKETQEKIAAKYNAMAEKIGDRDPDFLSAVYDLTADACRKRNREVANHPDVYYQSVGSVLQKVASGKFPLNFTYHLVKLFDGENDGLVGVRSFSWGEHFSLLRNHTNHRGISHGDMIDLNRENIRGFSVREFYVDLVHDLKEKGF